MRVLHIYKDYFPPVLGGIERHVNLLANGLAGRGAAVRVLVASRSWQLEQEAIGGIEVTRVPQIGRLASAPLAPTFSWWLRRLGRDCDILHFHFPNPTGELAALAAGLPARHVVTYHSDIVRQRVLLRFYAPFMHRFLRRADALIAASPNYVRTSKVLSRYEGKCRVIPYGVELRKYAPTEKDLLKIKALRSQFGPSILLFVGRFRYYKGLHILIEAMKVIDGRLLIVGAGPLERRLRRQVAEAGLQERVIFLGELMDEAMTLYLQACDIFVLPSVFRSEAFGIVQLEAMSFGKPVVSTELGTGTSFVNQHLRTGLVVPPSDPGAFAGAVNYLLFDGEVRKRYAQSGLERVEKLFGVDLMVDHVLDLYRACIEGRVRSAGPGARENR